MMATQGYGTPGANMGVQGYCWSQITVPPPVPVIHPLPEVFPIGGGGHVPVLDLTPCVTPEDIQRARIEYMDEEQLRRLRELRNQPDTIDLRPSLLNNLLAKGKELSRTIRDQISELRLAHTLTEKDKWELAVLRDQIAREKSELESQSASIMQQKRDIMNLKVDYHGGVPDTGEDSGLMFDQIPINLVPEYLPLIDPKELWEEKLRPFLVGMLGGAGLTVLALFLKKWVEDDSNEKEVSSPSQNPSPSRPPSPRRPPAKIPASKPVKKKAKVEPKKSALDYLNR